MGRHLSRRQVAGVLRAHRRAVPVDDQFLAVLANLAAASTPTTLEGTAMHKTRNGLRLAAAAGSVVLISTTGAYAANQVGHEPAKTPAPTSTTVSPDDAVQPIEPVETFEPSTTDDVNDDDQGDVNDNQDDQGDDDQGDDDQGDVNDNQDDQGDDDQGDVNDNQDDQGDDDQGDDGSDSSGDN